MKLAIMQPYVFPYIGYFQLLHAVDTFVFYDDVTFIKQGWVNRNRILVNGRAMYITVPVQSASSFVLIRDTRIASEEKTRWRTKMLTMLHQAYCRAPFYHEMMPHLQGIFSYQCTSISELAKYSVVETAKLLDITTTIIPSSVAYHNSQYTGEQRVIDICIQAGASVYINAAGGRELYHKEHFARHNIKLLFINNRVNPYPQRLQSKSGVATSSYSEQEFVPALSIIDVLMFNGILGTKALLQNYELIPA
jgi:hypothetical protein